MSLKLKAPAALLDAISTDQNHCGRVLVPRRIEDDRLKGNKKSPGRQDASQSGGYSGRITRRTPWSSSGTLKFTSNPSRSPLAFKYDRTWTRCTGEKSSTALSSAMRR